MKKFKIFLQNIKTWILVIAGIVILIEIVFFKAINDFAILITTVLLIMGAYLSNLNETIFVKIGLVLIVFCPFLLAFGQVLIAEKVAIWAYIFLFLGVARKIIIFLRQDGQSKEGI